MDEVPRAQFVEPDFAGRAYADQALPIACGQTISQPYVVAYMSEQLGVRPHHRVLEIGTGSGYQAAVLSRLAREVVSVERYRTLAEQARGRLEALGYDNVEVVVGDGLAGVPAKRRSIASSSPPRRRGRRKRWSISSPTAASWCYRSARVTDRNTSSSLPNRKRGLRART